MAVCLTFIDSLFMFSVILDYQKATTMSTSDFNHQLSSLSGPLHTFAYKLTKNSEEAKENGLSEVNSVRDELETAKNKLAEEKNNYAVLAEEKELLQKELDEKDDLLAQYREHLRQSKVESETSRKTILDLQNQLFESQIELVKANKTHIEKDIFKSIEDKMKVD